MYIRKFSIEIMLGRNRVSRQTVLAAVCKTEATNGQIFDILYIKPFDYARVHSKICVFGELNNQEAHFAKLAKGSEKHSMSSTAAGRSYMYREQFSKDCNKIFHR